MEGIGGTGARARYGVRAGFMATPSFLLQARGGKEAEARLVL